MAKFLDETGLAELWELIKVEDDKAPKIEIVSYVGTGEDTSATSPVTITFSFAPKVVMCVGKGSTYIMNPHINSYADRTATMVYMPDMPTTFTSKYGFGLRYNQTEHYYGRKSADGKTVEWYSNISDDSPSNSYNGSGTTYYFLGIG